LRIEVEVAEAAQFVGEFQRRSAKLGSQRGAQCRNFRFLLPRGLKDGARSQSRFACQAMNFDSDFARQRQRRGRVAGGFKHSDNRTEIVCCGRLRC
jgi:hypothetical protein